MQAYKRKYMKHYGYGEQDRVLCEVCHAEAVDIHHVIFRSQGGTNDIDNLIALCRSCHDKAHAKEITAEYLTEIHPMNHKL